MPSTTRLRFPRLRRIFFFLSGSRALPYSAGFLLLVTLAFAGLYTWLTPCGNGVKVGDEIPTNFGFTNALYFSIVTVSSLGYGDLRPVGWSRFLASVQVILGLSSMGVMIAALTSRQLSHLVSRLFASDVRKRLAELSTSFDDLEVQFEVLLRNISQVYAPTPTAPHEDRSADSQTVIPEFGDPSAALSEVSANTYNYFLDEAPEGHFFDLVPERALEKLLRSILDALLMLSQCLVSLPFRSENQIFSDVLRKPDRNNIMDSVEYLKRTCAIGLKHSRSENIRDLFRRVDDTCEKVSNNFFQVPEVELPDQIVYTSATPQTPAMD